MSKERKELKILLSVDKKIVSVNSMYMPGIKYVGGRPKPYIYKSPKAIEFSKNIRDQLIALDLSDYVDWLRNTKLFSVTISFIVKSGITRKDVQNMDKSLLDDITRYIKEDLGVDRFDDSLFTSVHFYKSVIPKAEKEYCCIQIVESTDNLRFDEIEEPERFFLGGTCAETKWREELIPELTKRGYTYFNPVVPDWTPECKEIEDIEKSEKCNTHLYILTPEMKGVYSVAEVINSAWECISGGSGFVYFGILGTQEDWGKAQHKSLQAVLDMVNNIGSGSSRIKAGWIKEPKDVLDL